MKSLLLALFLISSVPSCAAIYSNLPRVLAYAQDGELVVSAIETFSRTYFQISPNTDLEKKVDVAIARTRTALDSAIRLADGTGDLQKADLDTAFSEFRVAYTDLINLVAPLGISTEGTKIKVARAGLTVPSPMAFYNH